jgi:hypothetical protein
MNPLLKKYLRNYLIIMGIVVLIMAIVFWIFWMKYEQKYIAERNYNKSHVTINGTTIYIPIETVYDENPKPNLTFSINDSDG